MSKTLVWKPQAAFHDYFYTDPKDIKARRTVFREEFINYVSYGGRGSGKTYTFADAVIIEASIRPIRVLVTREIQLSIDESIKAELESAIKARGLEHFFQILQTEIRGLNGTKIIFKGLKNNINNLKSIADVDIVLCEESENITKNSWDKLLPSIRPKSGRPIVIVIFNPDNELDDTYQRFVISPPPKTVSKLINWRDNIYFPPFLEEQRQHAIKTLPKSEYEWIWEGVPKGSGGDVIIMLDWIKAARFASRHDKWQNTGGKAVGYDPAGQGKDYHATALCDGNRLTKMDEWLLSPDLREASERAMGMVIHNKSELFRYDECGGLGDGVSVFVDDAIAKAKEDRIHHAAFIEVEPFNAGDSVVDPKRVIIGTEKTNEETYTNAKAQAWGFLAQLLYNTYRFIELGEHDIEPDLLLSIDIEDDETFKKLARELSTPLWVKSLTNSKKKVEAKKDMEKRTGQKSPNLADAVVMCKAPRKAMTVSKFISRRKRR